MPRRRRLDIPATLHQLECVHGRVRYRPRFDPMEELVSCILSQHTADKNSFPAFTKLMSTYRTWEAIEHAPLEELETVIRRAGMAKQKARAIQGSIAIIRTQFGEDWLWPLRLMPVRESRAFLESLPGVGPKTASIVLCFALGLHAIPVDTHVFRVAKRLGWLTDQVNEVKAHDILLQQVPAGSAFAFHTLLIQHGRKVCRAPVPDCQNCGLQEVCPSSFRSDAKKRPPAKKLLSGRKKQKGG